MWKYIVSEIRSFRNSFSPWMLYQLKYQTIAIKRYYTKIKRTREKREIISFVMNNNFRKISSVSAGFGRT